MPFVSKIVLVYSCRLCLPLSVIQSLPGVHEYVNISMEIEESIEDISMT